MVFALSILRIFLGFVYLGITFWFVLAGQFLLLPSRAARVRFTSLWAKSVGFVCVRLTGVRVEFVGRERLNDLAPAIFVSNHTSLIDVLIAMWILPVGTTAVAKKQVLWIPFAGLVYALSGSLMLDRSKRTSAISGLESQSKFLGEHSLSVAIWPEGTRSRNGRLLPLKKGFAHVALWTRHPIVPMVVSGAYKAWRAGGFRIQEGASIRVEVCPPISSKDWTRAQLNEQIDSVYRVFLEHLPADQLPE